MPDWLKAILTSGAVWGALVALVNAIVALLWPDLPQTVVVAANALVTAIFAAVGIPLVRAQFRAIRAQRARGEYRP